MLAVLVPVGKSTGGFTLPGILPALQHRSKGRPPRWPSRDLDGEFDPGSGRTLAACLTHASRTRSNQWQHWGRPSGERGSKTGGTCPEDRDNAPKGTLIPDTFTRSHDPVKKWIPLREGLAAYQLVGGVMAHQG